MPKQLNLDLQIGFCWKIRGHCHYVCQKLVYTCWGGVSRRHTCNLWIGEQKPKDNPAAANVNMYAKSMATINCQQILYFGWFSGCYLPPDTSHCQCLSYAARIGHQQILCVFAFSGRRCWHLHRTYPLLAPTCAHVPHLFIDETPNVSSTKIPTSMNVVKALAKDYGWMEPFYLYRKNRASQFVKK